MRRLLLAIVTILACVEARAADVRAVNKTQDRVIIRLDKRELSEIEAGQERLFVFSGPEGDFYLKGVVIKVNVPRQTAVLSFEEPEPRFAKGMKVAFASTFWDSPLAPTIMSPGQFHQFKKPRFDAAFGMFVDEIELDVNDVKSKLLLDGTSYALFAYTPAFEDWLGLSFGLESVDGTWTFESDGEETGTIAISEVTLTPGVSVMLEPKWRVSLHYEYNVLTEEHDDDEGKRTFDFNLARPGLGLIYSDASFEAGILGLNRAKAKARDSVIYGARKSVEYVEYEKYDGEVMTFFRHAPSPTFLYQLALGAIFYERDRGDGEIGLKTELIEDLRFRSTFEHRLDGGSKFDWGLTYDGAHARTSPGQPLAEPHFTNRAGLMFGYRYPMTRRFTIGGVAQVHVGQRQVTDDRDPDDEDEIKFSSLGYQALLHAGYEIDLGSSRRSW